MTTAKEFYASWEDIEHKLIDMIASPMLPASTQAERHLKELYAIKKNLDKNKLNPSEKIQGVKTDIWGIVTFEEIQEHVKEYHDIIGEKYMIINYGAVMCEESQNDIQFFIERKYLPDNNIPENKKK
ncbi:MAG: hypothetical protein WCX73_04305 [Candidatus Pacearchaeota archaeon]|jgi:hypothetical protein